MRAPPPAAPNPRAQRVGVGVGQRSSRRASAEGCGLGRRAARNGVKPRRCRPHDDTQRTVPHSGHP
eukprot:5669447-Prymnesium_polylepis.1